MSAIELYIGTGLVEFSTDPQILYNYTQNEVNNPTVVKNSFSKTIVIEGTPSNNKLLGQYWNLERIEGAGGTGTVFNSSKKVEFNLFVNSQLYESGYVKLDSVKKNKGKIEYSITLYGGLGEFFYNLNTNDENGEKLNDSEITKYNKMLPEREKHLAIINKAQEEIDELIENMKKCGCLLINKEQADKLAESVLVKKTTKDGKVVKSVNRECVGRDAKVLLRRIGIEVGDEIRCVIAEVPFEHDFVQEELMMPILGIVRVKNIDEAIDLACKAEAGRRHSAHMHSKNIDNLSRMNLSLLSDLTLGNNKIDKIPYEQNPCQK